MCIQRHINKFIITKVSSIWQENQKDKKNGQFVVVAKDLLQLITKKMASLIIGLYVVRVRKGRHPQKIKTSKVT
jgi:hypothetical protein